MSPKWNVKIYNTGSIVCVDTVVLQDIINGNLKEPDSSLKVVQIDDSGGGFPLLGVMIGLNVIGDSEIWTDVVPVKYFQSPLYETGAYLEEYTRLGKALIDRFCIKPETHRIEICTGYINTRLKSYLRKCSFDVRVVEIKGLLQDRLEFLFKEYVKATLGKDLAYDPKEIGKSQLGQAYYSVLNWGKVNAPHLLKNGWKAIQEELKNA